MARRVYLHVGTPKSGTTYLQTLLWSNKRALRENGVLMPGHDRNDSLYAHMEIREQWPNLAKQPERASKAWTTIRKEIRDWDGDAVISHELLAAATAEQAGAAIAALAPAQVHVVLTARDYVKLVPALWQEAVKVGSPPRFDDFVTGMLEGRSHRVWGWTTSDVVDVADRWGRHVPADQVHIVTVPPSGAAPSLLWERFATVLGIDPAGYALPERPSNPSLGIAQAELLHRLDPLWPEPIGTRIPERHRWVRAYLAEQVMAGQPSAPITLPPQAAADLRERARQAIDEIDRRGYRVEGSLDDLVSVDLASQVGNPPLNDADLLDAALTTIVNLVLSHRALVLRRASTPARRPGRRTTPPAATPERPEPRQSPGELPTTPLRERVARALRRPRRQT